MCNVCTCQVQVACVPAPANTSAGLGSRHPHGDTQRRPHLISRQESVAATVVGDSVGTRVGCDVGSRVGARVGANVGDAAVCVVAVVPVVPVIDTVERVVTVVAVVSVYVRMVVVVLCWGGGNVGDVVPPTVGAFGVHRLALTRSDVKYLWH